MTAPDTLSAHTTARVRSLHVSGLARALRALLRAWLARSRQRAQLAELEPRMLRDIGVSADAARHEVRKPFWLP
jgi:uncharacterized protein YjiS (DUF1127 family)